MDDERAGSPHGSVKPSRLRNVPSSVAIGLVVAGILAVGGRGTFEHQVLIAIIAIAGVLLCAAAALTARVQRSRQGPWFDRCCRGTQLAGVICVLQVASLMVGLVIHERDVTAARLFCERAIHQLEEVRQRRGTYPRSLAETFDEPIDTPYLFRRSGVFVSSGDAFVLSFDEADGVVPHVAQYVSDRRAWTRF